MNLCQYLFSHLAAPSEGVVTVHSRQKRFFNRKKRTAPRQLPVKFRIKSSTSTLRSINSWLTSMRSGRSEEQQITAHTFRLLFHNSTLPNPQGINITIFPTILTIKASISLRMEKPLIVLNGTRLIFSPDSILSAALCAICAGVSYSPQRAKTRRPAWNNTKAARNTSLLIPAHPSAFLLHGFRMIR